MDSFIAIAQINADKFESELPNLNRTITFKYKPLIYWPFKSAQYDPVTQTLSMNSIFELLDGWIEKCLKESEQLGVNGFGVKSRFTKYKCTQIVLKDEWSFPMNVEEPRAASISMSPSEYRSFKFDSPVIEITFHINSSSREEVFQSFNNIVYATLTNPKEKVIKGFRVSGQLKKISIFTPDGKKKLASFERMVCSDGQTSDCVLN